jgi:hypothetical protein
MHRRLLKLMLISSRQRPVNASPPPMRASESSSWRGGGGGPRSRALGRGATRKSMRASESMLQTEDTVVSDEEHVKTVNGGARG